MQKAARDPTGTEGDKVTAAGDNRESSCDRFPDRPSLHTLILGWMGLIPTPFTCVCVDLIYSAGVYPTTTE